MIQYTYHRQVTYHEVMYMTKRTGVPALMEVARRLCILVTKFTPVLTTLYGGNADLMAALAAANAACSTLHEELSAVREYGV